MPSPGWSRQRPQRRGAVRGAIRRADERTLRWVAGTDHGVLNPALLAAARAADLLGPSFAATLWSVATEDGACRRAVARGWKAAATAGLVENTLKVTVHRPRPDPGRLPPGQRRRATPSTTAFPSGHIGVATAFATTTGAAVPALRPWLAASTLVTAYVRIYTGRHYLSDVLVGTAVGAAVSAWFHHRSTDRGGETMPGG